MPSVRIGLAPVPSTLRVGLDAVLAFVNFTLTTTPSLSWKPGGSCTVAVLALVDAEDEDVA